MFRLKVDILKLFLDSHLGHWFATVVHSRKSYVLKLHSSNKLCVNNPYVYLKT